jgi:hypothetical protein
MLGSRQILDFDEVAEQDAVKGAFVISMSSDKEARLLPLNLGEADPLAHCGKLVKRLLENLLRANYVVNPELTLRLSGQLGGRGWSMHAVLRLPTGVLVATGSDETLLGTMG